MHFERSVLSLYSPSPAEAAAFYVAHLGMRVDLDLGWFVSLRHEARPDFELALTQRDHPSVPEAYRRPCGGVALAFVVPDVDALHARLSDGGVSIVQPPTDHPWGQRQVLAAGPDGVLLDFIQIITPDPGWLAAHGLG